ncbi:MAG: hypothetical protein EOP04_13635 [Proteobacteria bacterium]|nr:MAG: hypothetical protein EOP04_13635 [Pseudomonadota bacterium]
MMLKSLFLITAFQKIIKRSIMISFELGQSLFHQGEFQRAATVLEGFCTTTVKNTPDYAEALFYRLRIYTELDQPEQRQMLEREIFAGLSGFDQKSLALFNYVQGYNALAERKFEEAHFLFEKALHHAFDSSCRYTLAQALFGCIFSALALEKDFTSIEHKMANLDLIAEQLDRPDLRVSVLSLKADIALQRKDYHRAIDLAWKAYDQVKYVRNNFLSMSIMTMVGYVYLKSGDHEKASLYLNLAHRSVDASIYKQLGNRITRLRSQLMAEPTTEFDLILDEQKNIVIEKSKGAVDFKNQFILVDLLKLLMENPGTPFSKEDLAKQLWNQKYNPAIHDNTIYVTIKRIRSLIEPNPHHSKYILRSRKGYLLNQDSKVLVQSKEPLT